MLVQLGISLIDNKKQCNINETLWLSYNHLWCILFVYNYIVNDFDYNSRMNQPIIIRDIIVVLKVIAGDLNQAYLHLGNDIICYKLKLCLNG
jgi:hypothetical protein